MSRWPVASARASRSNTSRARARTGSASSASSSSRRTFPDRAYDGRRVGVHVDLQGAHAPAGDLLGLDADRLGADGVHGRLHDVQSRARVDQRAEQHVPTGAGRALEPGEGHGTRADRRATRAANTPAPKPLSMLQDDDPGRTGVQHREQRGETPERRSVPHRGGNRHDRDPGEPADDRGQGAVHPGDDDQAVRLVQLGPHGEQPVQPSDPDVVDPADGGPEGARRERRLGGHLSIRSPRRDDRDPTDVLGQRSYRCAAGHGV